ncbi:MAG TPA: hydrogenase 3 maturation endopeptidase HyCI [Candidatus Omnitrophota bacterium]|nr:hydrogenase 3 maturation endopeptidase HyCI [Candidatus Omnitrophota bacterium]
MSNSLTAEILEVLKLRPDQDLIITAGNSFRKDDGVGPYLSQKLSKLPQIRILHGGDTPENIMEEAIAMKPSRVLVFDAADFGGRAGETRIIPEHSIPQTAYSTHSIPLNVITGIIAGEAHAEVIFIGIQPRSVEFGEGLSAEVKWTADAIAEAVLRQFSG